MSDVTQSSRVMGPTVEETSHFFDRAYGRNPSLGEVRNIDLSPLKFPAREDLGIIFSCRKGEGVHPLVQASAPGSTIEGVVQDGIERFKVVLSEEEWRTVMGDMRQQYDVSGLVQQVPLILKDKCRS